jgi:hypothetical protein
LQVGNGRVDKYGDVDMEVLSTLSKPTDCHLHSFLYMFI